MGGGCFDDDAYLERATYTSLVCHHDDILATCPRLHSEATGNDEL